MRTAVIIRPFRNQKNESTWQRQTASRPLFYKEIEDSKGRCSLMTQQKTKTQSRNHKTVFFRVHLQKKHPHGCSSRYIAKHADSHLKKAASPYLYKTTGGSQTNYMRGAISRAALYMARLGMGFEANQASFISRQFSISSRKMSSCWRAKDSLKTKAFTSKFK